MDMDEDRELRSLREAVAKGRVLWHHHALERLLERGISRAEVMRTIPHGDAIERYPERRPFPSYLILHVDPLPLHVVAASDSASVTCHIVTVYRPDLQRFEPDFRTRRKLS